MKMNEIEHKAMASAMSLAARFAITLNQDGNASMPSWERPALVARNSNIPLVTMTLSAFIEHAVTRRSHGDEIVTAHALGRSNDYTGQICVLLQALLSLTRTIGGASGPQTALRALMAKYPDELLGIWSTQIVA